MSQGLFSVIERVCIMDNPVLSIGIMFKNDIRCLERCLRSLEPLRQALPCQLVMADTGATDGSREVAEQYADLLFDFPWIDDFAAARNAMMDRSVGKWYLTVDTDEFLDEDISELVKFLTASGKHREEGGSLIQRNYRTRDMRAGDYSDFMALRIIRMDTGVRYQGAIHEAWGGGKRQLSAYPLTRTVLHHDGYAKDAAQDLRRKMDRNLALLRKELAAQPNDMRRLVQCQDASIYYPQERWEYMLRGMEYVQQLGHKAQGNPLAAVLYRNAASAALYQNMPQADEWLAWGETHMSQSIFFRVDVVAAAAARSYQRKDYEAALYWAQRYQKGMSDYAAGRYSIQELTVNSLLSGMESTRLSVTLVECEALVHLGRKDEAEKRLEQVDLTLLHGRSDLGNRLLNLLILLGGDRELAQRMCADLLSMVWDEEQTWAQGIRRYGMFLANRLLEQRQQSKDWMVFAMAPGDLGVAVRSVAAQQPQEISDTLERIEKWECVPVQCLAYAIERGVPFPQGFFAGGEEQLREVAMALGADQTVRNHLPVWAECDDFYASLRKCQFLFLLLASALRQSTWDGQGQRLLDGFLEISSAYLPAVYHPRLLEEEEEWSVMPGLHRCALCLLQAHEAGREQNQREYVRWLRAALGAAPAMKGAVDEMLAHTPKSETDIQLEQLAQQVRTVLDRYPSGDPAVEALKASPAYQRVAHLLTAQGEPSVQSVPSH